MEVDQKRWAGKYYEKRVAWILRREGWQVDDIDGVNDHGIDLIARKNGVVRYIQCKGWSWWKIIHDDVVSQLYGSVAGQVGPENLNNGQVEMYIYSPAQLGDYARQEAERLNIHFVRLRLRARHHPN